ncbi:unnamed protein product, partial [Choristocarpus tenellus]
VASTQVKKALNLIWLMFDGCLQDPLSLMEVCAAVQNGIQVIPIRVLGQGVLPISLSIWGGVGDPLLTAHGGEEDSSSRSKNSKTRRIGDDPYRDLDEEKQENGPVSARLATKPLDDNTRGREEKNGNKREKHNQLGVDHFFEGLSQSLPKCVRDELHSNRFLIRDVVAAIRIVLTGDTGSSPLLRKGRKSAVARAGVGAVTEVMLFPMPSLFDVKSDHSLEEALERLLGAGKWGRRRNGKEGVKRENGPGNPVWKWNWERLPHKGGSTNRNDGSLQQLTVPLRNEEELLQLIQEENAKTEDLAGKL